MAHLLSFERRPANPSPFPFLEPLFESLAETVRSTAGRPFVTLSHVQSLDGAAAQYAGAEAETLTEALRARHDAVLRSDGAEVQLIQRDGAKTLLSLAGETDSAAILAEIAGLGLRSLLVEGDAGLIGSFLDPALADYCVITVVPRFLGGQGASLAAAEIAGCRYQPLGQDLIVYGPLRGSGSEPSGAGAAG
ncbi:MAG: dihydrofolate reductase family protein [Methylococcus sp.]|nr:dihydrofolate reductase family protein [Methylococcus sp.]